MRILIVEDSKILRDYLALGLRRAGFAVDTLGDGQEALHQIEEVGYDVVILDRMLPGLDGDAVLVALRQQACDCRVLMLSARDRVEDRIEGLELDDRVEPMSNVVDAAVYCLRPKLDDRNGPSLIKTRRGQGYILETHP